ncbi:MAG: TIGR00730 family Rossman fold protein [Gemmatimonadota bacterium]
MSRTIERLCVFCGSNSGARPEYSAAARDLGATLAEAGITLVYGGASVGMMGELADAALARGGRVMGVIPSGLVEKEVAHTGIADLIVVGSMHERKARMADLSDAFIALPGGLGTLEEFFEILTWAQLGIHDKPCGLLNVAHYYDPLLGFADQAVQEGFIKPEHRRMLLQDEDAHRLLEQMRAYEAPELPKWVSRR